MPRSARSREKKEEGAGAATARQFGVLDGVVADGADERRIDAEPVERAAPDAGGALAAAKLVRAENP